MNTNEIKSAIVQLSDAQVAELFDWPIEHQAQLLSQELDRRLDAYSTNLAAGASWPEVQDRIAA